jgi:hypothetical protein
MALFRGNVIIPQININGTPANYLVSEAEAAYAAVMNAVRAVESMTVHGRDFQTCPAPEAVTGKALQEHRERLFRLHQIRDDLNNILQGLYEQRAELKR